MDILLLAPPIANPFYPPLGLPSLAAAIRQTGRHSCRTADLSIESVRHILSAGFIARCRSEVSARMHAYRGVQALPAEQQSYYFRTARAFVKAHGLEDAVQRAVACFTDENAFADRRERRRAIETLDDAFELIGAAYPPYIINRSEFSCGSAPFSLKDVIIGLETQRSPLADFLEHRVQDLLSLQPTGLVGISINYYGQLIAGLELARSVRQISPSARIVVGGSLMPEVAELLASDPALSPLFDFVICYEGETALLSLLDCLEEGRDPWLSGVPNLMGRDGDGARVRIRHRESMERLPTPDFDDFVLASYLSPAPILPLLTSRGCYWGSCAFCTHFHTYGNDYRTLQATGLMSHIEELQRRHGCKHFYFVDESLAPSKALAFAQLILERDLDITWGTEIRFERALSNTTLELMASAGCRALSFGLESGSQRVLDLMGKGILVEDVHRILHGCSEQGIAAHAMCIIGFPGETLEDFAKTVELIDQHRGRLALLGFSPFTLNVNSIVHKDPSRFGVSMTDTADILRPDRNYSVESGLSQSDSYALYDEIVESDLVSELDQRAAVATREHLLLVGDCPVDSETNPIGDLQLIHLVLPFSLARSEQADAEAHGRRQSQLIGSVSANAPTASDLMCADAHMIFVPGTRRILEVGESVIELLAGSSDGSVAIDDPRFTAVLRELAGAERAQAGETAHA